MSDNLYQVIFYGQIHQDAKLDEVKARIGKMFKADEVTVARLFSGKRIVIKKNLSAEAADKYSIAFAKVGAICELDLMPDDSAANLPAGDRADDTGDASSERNFKKIAAISALAVVVVIALAAAALYFTGFFGN